MDDKTPGMLSIPEEGSKMASEAVTALATAPIQGEVVHPWDGMKPVSREMARMLTSDQVLQRQRAIGAFTKVYSGVVRDKVQEFREEIVDFIRRVKDGEIAVYDPKDQRCAGIKEAVPVVYGFSYSYLCEILRGGKKSLPPKKNKKEEKEDKPHADAESQAIPIRYPTNKEEWKHVFRCLNQEQRQEVLEAIQETIDEIKEEEIAREAGSLSLPGDYREMDLAKESPAYARARAEWRGQIGPAQALEAEAIEMKLKDPNDPRLPEMRKKVDEAWEKVEPFYQRMNDEEGKVERKRQRVLAAKRGKETKLRNIKLRQIQRHLKFYTTQHPKEGARTAEDCRPYLRVGNEPPVTLEYVRELFRAGAEKEMWFLLPDGRAMLNDSAARAEAAKDWEETDKRIKEGEAASVGLDDGLSEKERRAKAKAAATKLAVKEGRMLPKCAQKQAADEALLNKAGSLLRAMPDGVLTLADMTAGMLGCSRQKARFIQELGGKGRYGHWYVEGDCIYTEKAWKEKEAKEEKVQPSPVAMPVLPEHQEKGRFQPTPSAKPNPPDHQEKQRFQTSPLANPEPRPEENRERFQASPLEMPKLKEDGHAA